MGDWVRDKDGVSSLLAFALLTSHLRSQDKTVLQYLEDIYRTSGLYTTAQKSLALEPGADAGALGKLLRQSPPATIAGQVVTATCDLLTLTRTTLDGTTEDSDLPPSDVLVFYLEDQTRIIVRPSGTEPKVKCYYETIHSVPEAASFSDTQAQAARAMEDLISTHQKELATLGE